MRLQHLGGTGWAGFFLLGKRRAVWQHGQMLCWKGALSQGTAMAEQWWQKSVAPPECRCLGSVPSPQGDAALIDHVTACRASPKTGSGPFCS